jgi:hypothetical protein
MRCGIARRSRGLYVEHYNAVRLHSTIGYITPKDQLDGRAPAIFADRDRKPEAARERRKARRHAAHEATLAGELASTTMAPTTLDIP